MRASLEQRKFPLEARGCKEGVLSLVSGGFIPKDAPHQDFGHAVINAMVGPDYAKNLTKLTGYMSTSRFGPTGLSPEDAKKAGYGNPRWIRSSTTASSSRPISTLGWKPGAVSKVLDSLLRKP
jgi:hypothetical protein